MEVILPVRSIKYATSLLTNIANTRTPYMQPYIQIIADSEEVTFFATNYEVSAKFNFPHSEVHATGKAIVTANSLNGFVSRLYEEDDNKATSEPVHIGRTGKGKLKIKTQTTYKQGDVVKHNLLLEEKHPEAFSTPFTIDEGSFAEIDGLFLKEGLEKTGYAMSTDDTTAPVFRGVNFISNGSSFRLTSTDGKELARYARDVELPTFDKVITANVVSNLAKNIDPTKSVYFYFKDGKIYARTGYIDIMGSTIVEDFPNVDSVLAAENYNHFLVSKTVLQDSILNIMPNVDTKSNRINLLLENGELTVKGVYTNETTNVGIKIYDFEGEFAFDCNGWYLHKAISKIESDTVKIMFRKPEEPLIVKDETEQPFDMTTLIVPMRKF